MANKVRVEGLKEFRSALRKLPPEYRKELAAIHKEAATPVAETARLLAPSQSGNLAASIRPLGSQREGRVAAGSKSRVPYAGPIHWGWPKRNIAPNPFLVEALNSRRQAVISIFTRQTDSLIEKVWRVAGVPRR